MPHAIFAHKRKSEGKVTKTPTDSLPPSSSSDLSTPGSPVISPSDDSLVEDLDSKLSFLETDGNNPHGDEDDVDLLPSDSSSDQEGDHLPLSSSPDPSTSYSFDKATIADLVASFGSSSSTAWLEFDRYRIWQAASSPTTSTADKPFIEESSFPPVVGYMHTRRYVFPWGDPIVSSPAALEKVTTAFVGWAKNQGLKVVWCCVGYEMEEVLAKMGWATVQCIHEEVLHPEHVLEVTGWGAEEEDEEERKERKKRERREKKERKEKEKEQQSKAEKKEEHKEERKESKSKERTGSSEWFDKEKLKDLKKNLRRAERAGVHAVEITGKWNASEREQVEHGMLEWRRNKGLKGVQLASTTGQPWIDESHRRYWIAKQENTVVGILILTPIHPPHDSHHPNLGLSPPTSPTSSSFPSPPSSPTGATAPYIKSYLIKNAVSFPSAPRGTSEHLIYTAMAALTEEEHVLGIPITVTFGITASDTLKVGHNLGGHTDCTHDDDASLSHSHSLSRARSIGHSKGGPGWKITTLSAIYNKVAKGAGLLKRGDFRAKFDTEREGMYVAYEVGSKGEGLGLDGVRSLLKVLRK
ncbi:hypothetical protein D9758_004337 [Tetrapyrgos nigripes]|uniref:Uncharacterized protein n=1 Tax=Tetrapyrgos nigripes TaxID=182062 RepID=A0A8H5LSR9_9AGAR|nr:hypothetical protein D9758_004337 [Tetrapyrgos nigripes]